MSREIKFRAWNKKIRFMDVDFYVFASGQIFESALRGYDTPNIEIEEAPDLVLMQYTGIKDKNGREIYEGDIFDSHFKWIVEFNNGMFGCQTNAGFSTLNYLLANRAKAKTESYVIGNIYENPELIKK